MIREVVVVEGKRDITAVQRAVDAECLITGGYALSPHNLSKIEAAYHRTGIIILTDPDSAGERIRKFLAEKFPQAKHAFIARSAALADDGTDIGVEQANEVAIKSALVNARCQEWQPQREFTYQDMQASGLAGSRQAMERRAAIGERLGIGYANAKTFLRRLNNYGVSREEFVTALKTLEEVNA